MSDYKIETKCIQSGYEPGNGEARVLPIYQSTTFRYTSSEQMGRLFDLEERNSPPGRRNTPLRTTNPIRNLSPHPPQCEHWGTFPPGGRLNESGRRNLPCK